MVQDGATPEKKLLELIESPTGNTLREIKKKRKRIGLVSPGALKGRFSFFKRFMSSSLEKHRVGFDIKKVNAVLIVCIIGLAVYLAWDWVDATAKLNEISGLTSEPAEAQEQQAKPFLPLSLLKEISYYSQKVNSRNIFELDLKTASPEEGKSAAVEEKIITPKDELMELTEYFVLVGVSWSDDPVAMIEDTDAKMTYFKRKGEEVEKGVRIKQIFIDKIILEYNGAEVELKL